MLDDLFEFLQEGVTPYHAAATAAAWLDAAGFTRLEEADYWNLRSEERRVGKECRSRWSPYH